MKIEYFKVWLSLILIFTLNCQEVKNNALKKNSIIDDLNNEFTFVNPPQKVISLAPNLTEIIFKLGLGAKIVGNTTLCNYPDSAKTIKNVGDLLTVDLEKVISFIDKLETMNGIDACEDSLGGLVEALKLNWKSSAKMAILVTDCPCHGKKYIHKGTYNYYLNQKGLDDLDRFSLKLNYMVQH